MLYGFVGRTTQAAHLKQALDVSAERTRAIANRVSRASLGGDGFALPEVPTPGTLPTDPTAPVDVEAEMVSLADEQLRYETTAKLLQSTYQALKASIRER
jgi:flagellar basal body rod protein FlgB